jgi:hypothetical protein
VPVGGAALAFIAIGLRPKAPGVAPRLDFMGAVVLITGAAASCWR